MSRDASGKPVENRRSDPESLRARGIAVSLTVQDLETSLKWYRDVVGFTVSREITRDGKRRAVGLVAGAVRIMLNQDDGAKGWNRVKGQGMSLMLTTAQSVDAIAQRIKKMGGTLQSEPADMPWGARIFRVHDPDGFVLVFASET